MVGECVVYGYVIKLRRRLIVLSCPVFAAISGDAGAAITDICDSVWVRWIDPKSVMISVPRGHEAECLSAIDRFKEACVYQINRVCRFWVRVNFAEVPGALAKSAVIIYSRPMLASVIGAVEAAILRLND